MSYPPRTMAIQWNSQRSLIVIAVLAIIAISTSSVTAAVVQRELRIESIAFPTAHTVSVQVDGGEWASDALTLEYKSSIRADSEWFPVRATKLVVLTNNMVRFDVPYLTEQTRVFRVVAGELPPDYDSANSILDGLLLALPQDTNRVAVGRAIEELRHSANMRAYRAANDRGLVIAERSGLLTYLDLIRGDHTNDLASLREIPSSQSPGATNSVQSNYRQVLASNAVLSAPPGLRKAAIFVPFHGFEEPVPDITSALDAAGYIVETFKFERCTLANFFSILRGSYDVIYIATHGNPGVERSVIALGQDYDDQDPFFVALEKPDRQGIGKYKDWTRYNGDEVPKEYRCPESPDLQKCGKFCVDSSVIARYAYPGSIVYLDACDSSVRGDFPRAFLGGGAAVFLGWDVVVANDVATRVAKDVFKSLKDGMSIEGALLWAKNVRAYLTPMFLPIFGNTMATDSWLPPHDLLQSDFGGRTTPVFLNNIGTSINPSGSYQVSPQLIDGQFFARPGLGDGAAKRLVLHLRTLSGGELTGMLRVQTKIDGTDSWLPFGEPWTISKGEWAQGVISFEISGSPYYPGIDKSYGYGENPRFVGRVTNNPWQGNVIQGFFSSPYQAPKTIPGVPEAHGTLPPTFGGWSAIQDPLEGGE